MELLSCSDNCIVADGTGTMVDATEHALWTEASGITLGLLDVDVSPPSDACKRAGGTGDIRELELALLVPVPVCWSFKLSGEGFASIATDTDESQALRSNACSVG